MLQKPRKLSWSRYTSVRIENFHVYVETWSSLFPEYHQSHLLFEFSVYHSLQSLTSHYYTPSSLYHLLLGLSLQILELILYITRRDSLFNYSAVLRAGTKTNTVVSSRIDETISNSCGSTYLKFLITLSQQKTQGNSTSDVKVQKHASLHFTVISTY